WFGIEDWGAWTCANTVQLEFDVTGFDGIPADENLLLLLGLRGHAQVIHVSVAVDGVEIGAFDIGKYNSLARLELPRAAIASGHCGITIHQDKLVDVTARTHGADVRLVGIGVRRFMLCRAADLPARVGLLESEVNYIVASRPA